MRRSSVTSHPVSPRRETERPRAVRRQRAWCRYFGEYLPHRSNQAALLFDEWRCSLVKDEIPGRGVVITHGQPQAHWLPTDHGLCINLESMWDEFIDSVSRFVERLRADDEIRNLTLERFHSRQWTVQQVIGTTMRHPTLTANRAFGSHGVLATFPASAWMPTAMVVQSEDSNES